MRLDCALINERKAHGQLLFIAETARSTPHTLRSPRLADEQLAELTMLCGVYDDPAALLSPAIHDEPDLSRR